MEQRAKRFFGALENRSPLFWTVAGIAIIGLLGILDYVTGNELTLSLFYLIPIVLVTWVVDRKAGLFMSFISGLTLLGAEIAAGQTYAYPIFYLLD